MKRAHRIPLSAAFVLALTAPSFGCPGNGSDDGGDERPPFRDEWQVAADVDFIHTNAEGVQIFDLTIGGRLTNDNFANRGDVIVNFDGPSNRILVEMRRFTQTTDSAQAEVDFDALSLWAFTSGLGRPQDQDPADDCVASGWQNACSIRVYYDGQSQLQRAGADLRVTLPSDYRRKITVITEDNVADDDYYNRGDVCIGNMFASADVETQSGNIWVTMAPETNPSPRCTLEQVQACEDFTIDDENGNPVPAPWAPECPCIAEGGGEFGRLAIENRDSSASDIKVQIPGALWASIRAENQGETQSQSGEFCESVITVPDVEYEPTGNDFPWQASANANYPGEPAIKGAGYSIQAVSNDCAPVAHTDDPGDFVGVGNGDDQESSERGNIEVCADCITQTCDQLIP